MRTGQSNRSLNNESGDNDDGKKKRDRTPSNACSWYTNDQEHRIEKSTVCTRFHARVNNR